MDASGDPPAVLETLYQCYESQSLYLRSYHSSTLPPDDSITIMDFYDERNSRRFSMKGFTLEDQEGTLIDSEENDPEDVIRPFSLKHKNRISDVIHRRESYERKRESLGVYGAIMQVNWEEEKHFH